MKKIFALICLLCVAWSASVLAADEPATGRIPTVTRLVKIFAGLEEDLAEKLRAGNSDAVEKMLVSDFELRAGPTPGNPTPKAEWMRGLLGKTNIKSGNGQMAVHDFGDVAVVSFLQADANGDARKNLFTVDVWKRSGDTWLLAVRYSGPSGGKEFLVPGTPTEHANIPKKY